MPATLISRHFSVASLLALFELPKDPLGLMAGLRAHEEFEALANLRDDELAARGLSRADINREILKAMRAG